ncbi:MAG TPA: glycerophosphodiester phosphodiesterase [Lacipirellulaceae bacterium]|nr:glycerophosphodiester phosphodiesterase [Lacipirellulaceae bacterium]
MAALSSSASAQLIIGHRGASHDAPENTIASYKLAIEQGADGFEGDYWLNADGHILDLHDADTKRVSGKKLSVTKAPFDALRALDIGSSKDPKFKGEKIPTLEEVLAAVPVGKKVFLELKSGPEVVGPMAKVIAKSSVSPEQIVIISFHDDAIAEAKKQMPHIKALWLCGFKPKDEKHKPLTAEQVADTIKRINADGLDAEAVPDYVDAAFIKKLKDLGCQEVSVWTVDDPTVAKFYSDLGVWSITTNRPGWLRAQLASK